jgi:hypothetical protein
MRIRMTLAAIAAAASATTSYAALRVSQALGDHEPDPALVVWNPHAGFFWRAWTSAYIGGMVAFVVFYAAGRDADRTARVLVVATTVATIAIAAQGLLVP